MENTRPAPESVKCPECGYNLMQWEKVCPECGAVLPASDEEKIMKRDGSEFPDPPYDSQ